MEMNVGGVGRTKALCRQRGASARLEERYFLTWNSGNKVSIQASPLRQRDAWLFYGLDSDQYVMLIQFT
jgi:hypothetical protein